MQNAAGAEAGASGLRRNPQGRGLSVTRVVV